MKFYALGFIAALLLAGCDLSESPTGECAPNDPTCEATGGNDGNDDDGNDDDGNDDDGNDDDGNDDDGNDDDGNDDDGNDDGGNDDGGGGDDGGGDDGGDDDPIADEDLPATTLETNYSLRNDLRLVCKLINEEERFYQTENDTHLRYNLAATDLGVPAIVGDTLHLFFGDTHGFQGIWRIGEDPDAVARVNLQAVQNDLTVLCRDLQFYVTNDIPSVASSIDSRIQRDFEGMYLGPPPGEHIRDYIDRPLLESPEGAFAGSFEVPSGAISHKGNTYVYWSTRTGTSGAPTGMRLSFIAHWPTAGASPLFLRILHPIDGLDNGERLLGGHFIQNAPVIRDNTLYLFGTGPYRQDGVHLARKPADQIAEPGGFELYDPRDGSWKLASSLTEQQRASIPAIVDEDIRGIGELGVQYVEEAGIYVMMYQHCPNGSCAQNYMVMQVATRPQGPWTRTNIISMNDPIFRNRHCCFGDLCYGDTVLRCDQAGLYGIYPLPLIQATARNTGYDLKVPFVASTWVPYNVVLFEAEVFVRALP